MQRRESGVGSDAMRVEVSNFGPIVEAAVDLRPLNVFIGPSNTGKSYLAILVYALHRMFCAGPRFPGGSWHGGSMFWAGNRDKPLSEAQVDALCAVGRAAAKRRSDGQGPGSLVLPAPAADVLRSGLDGLGEALAGEIVRCFGVGEAQALTRKGSRHPARVVLRRRLSEGADPGEHRLSLARKPEFVSTVPAGMPVAVDFSALSTGAEFMLNRIRLLDGDNGDAWHGAVDASDLRLLVGELILPALVGPLHVPAQYLPADRTGIMHAHSVIVRALIADASRAGLRPRIDLPMLSGVLADFLYQLIGIDQTAPSRNKAEGDVDRRIEEEILLGNVGVDRSPEAGYPRFTYRPRGWKSDLALTNASSMVSELAPLVLYLRHLVRPGNVLIIEEPESHLHPAAQVVLMRQLAALVDQGIRIVVTTHSEWLLEALANIVRGSEVSRPNRGTGITLRPDQVGVWLFEQKQRPRGSVVREIPLEDETGLFPSEYDAVAAELHNDWADITRDIEAGA